MRRQSKNKVVSGGKCFLIPEDSRGEVLISSFLQPFAGGQGQKVSLELNRGTLMFRQRGRFPEAGRYVCLQLETASF